MVPENVKVHIDYECQQHNDVKVLSDKQEWHQGNHNKRVESEAVIEIYWSCPESHGRDETWNNDEQDYGAIYLD